MNNSLADWSQKIAAQYDSLYEAHAYHRGVEPLSVVRWVAKERKAGRVLDIGGGEGRHALFLARLGFVVDVVDLSKVGLERVKSVATAEGLSVKTIQADITDINLTHEYNLVIISFVLHHVPYVDAAAMLESAKDATARGGAHVYAGFTDEGQLYKRAKKADRFYPSKKELLSIYSGWETITFNQKHTTTMAKDKTGAPLTNQMIELVTQKV